MKNVGHIMSKWFCIWVLLLCGNVFPLIGQLDQNIHIALLNAAERGDLEQAKDLLMQGADINVETFEKVTPLMYAVLRDQTSMVKFLLTSGADPNMLPDDKNSPLIQSVYNGNLEIGKQLIYHGASQQYLDAKGLSAMGYSIVLDKLQFLDMLLQFKPDLESIAEDQTSALQLAALKGNYAAAELLLKHGADINRKDVWGMTPLMIAAQKGRLNIVKLLLEMGADADLKDLGEYDALAHAIRNNHTGVVEILLNKQQNILEAGDRTMYVRALKTSRSDSVKTLLRTNGLQPKFQLSVDGTLFGAGYLQSGDEQQLEFNIGMKELGSQVEFYLSYNRRLNRSVIWTEASDVFYQFNENRQSFGVSAKRAFPVVNFEYGIDLSLVPCLALWRSFYKYEGAQDHFDQEWLYQYGTDLRMSWRANALEIGVHLMDYDQYLKDRWYFRIGYSQSVYIKNKPVKFKRDRWKNLY